MSNTFFLMDLYLNEVLKPTYKNTVDDFRFKSDIFTKISKNLETETERTIELILPGYKKSDIKIEFYQSKLKVYFIGDEKSDKYKFNYEFNIKNANIEKIKAKLENGILNIIVPKKEIIKNNIEIE